MLGHVWKASETEFTCTDYEYISKESCCNSSCSKLALDPSLKVLYQYNQTLLLMLFPYQYEHCLSSVYFPKNSIHQPPCLREEKLVVYKFALQYAAPKTLVEIDDNILRNCLSLQSQLQLHFVVLTLERIAGQGQTVIASYSVFICCIFVLLHFYFGNFHFVLLNFVVFSFSFLHFVTFVFCLIFILVLYFVLFVVWNICNLSGFP